MEAIKVPGIWLVSLNVFMVYIVYCGLTYFIPYLKEMYGLPVALVGAYGIINQYFLKISAYSPAVSLPTSSSRVPAVT